MVRISFFTRAGNSPRSSVVRNIDPEYIARGICRNVTAITEFCRISFVPGSGCENSTRPETSINITNARMNTHTEDNMCITLAILTSSAVFGIVFTFILSANLLSAIYVSAILLSARFLIAALLTARLLISRSFGCSGALFFRHPISFVLCCLLQDWQNFLTHQNH